MSWIVSVLVRIGRWLFPRLVCAYFTPARGEQHRESDRKRWWSFAERSKLSPSKADDAVAAYLKARFNFHDSPEIKAAKAEMEGVLHNTSRLSGEHQP